MGWPLIHRSEYVVGEYFLRLLVHTMRVVIRAGDHDAHIQSGNRDHFISTVARHEEGWIALLARLERFQPPQVAILSRLINAGMGTRRRTDPGFTYYSFSAPLPSIQIELRELQQVAAVQVQTAPGHGRAEAERGL